MYSNKGMSGAMSALLWVVVGVMVLLVALFLLQEQITGIKNIFNKNDCANQVKAHALSLKVSKPTEYIPGMSIRERIESKINCPTEFKDVDTKDVEKIEANIAKEMVSCWKTWGKGELELFKDEEGGYCHICTVLEFDNDVKIPADEFTEFLSENPRKEDSYLKQILPFKTNEINDVKSSLLEQWERDQIMDIDTSKEQAVIFKYLKGEKVILDQFNQEDVQELGAFGVGMVGAYTGFKAGGLAGTLTCSPAGPIALLCSTVGAVGGAIAGGAGTFLVMGILAEEPTQRMSSVSVIPYEADHLRNAGCTIAPVQQ